jgi:hypothetical protein
MHNIEVIENFNTFPESIIKPSYDQRLRNYDHCKLGVLLEILGFWTKQLSGQIWTLSLFPMENWKSHEYKGPREIYNLSNEK